MGCILSSSSLDIITKKNGKKQYVYTNETINNNTNVKTVLIQPAQTNYKTIGDLMDSKLCQAGWEKRCTFEDYYWSLHNNLYVTFSVNNINNSKLLKRQNTHSFVSSPEILTINKLIKHVLSCGCSKDQSINAAHDLLQLIDSIDIKYIWEHRLKYSIGAIVFCHKLGAITITTKTQLPGWEQIAGITKTLIINYRE